MFHCEVIDRLEKECQWNATSSTFDYPQCIEQFLFERDRSPFDLDQYYDQVDIVIPATRDLDFLEYWKTFFYRFHFIIIQDGDPKKVLKIPTWVDYELFNRDDIERILGKTRSWIISSQDASIRSFGFLVSRRTFVYTMDEECLPAEDTNHEKVDAIFKHIQNLVTNSTPYFFNTLYDPYQTGSDFVRGYPFNLRQGVSTVVSHGLWLNAPDYDAPTQLLKIDERNTRFVDITQTVPAGILYSMGSMNVAFNRRLIGAAFMQGLMGKGMPWARYGDMFAGWASKVIADHLKLGVKTGSPYVTLDKASNPFTDLEKEYMGLFWQEEIIALFQQVHFSSSAITPEQCYLELAQMIRENLTHLNDYFYRLATAMEIWIDFWKQSQASLLAFQPSRRSSGQNRTGQVAVFTIFRSDSDYLPIWLKYYQRYFLDSNIYILDVSRDDNSTMDLPVHVQRIHSDKYFDHQWIVDVVENQTRALLNAGYLYVLFTEIDEMVVPDPLKYPLGFTDYFSQLKRVAVRVQAYDIWHDQKQEAKLNSSQPILQQRRFWMRHELYDKPLLTSSMLHWTNGFHSCSEKVDR